jgi:hypothetical protein
MKNICISASFGSGNSFLRMLTFDKKVIDPAGTCHTAWNQNLTKNGDYINVTHLYDLSVIRSKFSPDITVWLQINKKNLLQICQRIVVLEFLYAKDTYDYVFHWTRKKHDEIAGPNWPVFSTTITDYPGFCLDELCQVAHNRCELWARPNDNFDFQIDSDELFGDSDPVTIKQWLKELNCQLDMDFFNSWKTKQQELFLKYQSLFHWQPEDQHVMTRLQPDPTKGVW